MSRKDGFEDAGGGAEGKLEEDATSMQGRTPMR